MPPTVPTSTHSDLIAGPFDHDTVFNGFTVFHSRVSVGFQGYDFAGAKHTVCCDHNFCLAIIDAILQTYRGKSGKNNRMHSTDPGTGQHGHCQFRYHGQIDGDPVALFHPFFLQDIGKSADFGVQHLIGIDPDIFIRLTLPNNRRFVAPTVQQMSIETIVRDIKLSAFKPSYLRLLQICPQHCIPLP